MIKPKLYLNRHQPKSMCISGATHATCYSRQNKTPMTSQQNKFAVPTACGTTTAFFTLLLFCATAQPIVFLSHYNLPVATGALLCVGCRFGKRMPVSDMQLDRQRTVPRHVRWTTTRYLKVPRASLSPRRFMAPHGFDTPTVSSTKQD